MKTMESLFIRKEIEDILFRLGLSKYYFSYALLTMKPKMESHTGKKNIEITSYSVRRMINPYYSVFIFLFIEKRINVLFLWMNSLIHCI